MRTIGLVMVLASCASTFAPDPACADGLIQSLPPDGAWVRYNFRCRVERGGSQKELIGELTIKSVGAVQHDGRPHRWIETVLDYRESTGGGERREIAKMLFPESELDGKGSPRSHLARRWRTETIVSIEHKLWPTNCVPFGIGAAEHALRFRVGDRESVYDYELEINDFGDGAVSELPNQN